MDRGRSDDPSGDSVELTTRDARLHGRDRGPICIPDQAEDRQELRVRLAVGIAAGDPERPRDVRAVALPNAPDVEHDRVARLDRSIARLVVGRGRVRTRRHDGERRRLMALVDQPLADLAADVRLRPPDQPARCDAQHHAVRRVGGSAEPLDFVR